MAWRDYYYELTIPTYSILFTFISPSEKKEFKLSIIFIFLIYYAIHGFSCVCSLSLILFMVTTSLYLWILSRLIYFSDITIYLNKKKYSLGLNQGVLHRTHKRNQEECLLFLTAKKNNCSKDFEEKLAFIEA